jgi:hypothetical protein
MKTTDENLAMMYRYFEQKEQERKTQELKEWLRRGGVDIE